MPGSPGVNSPPYHEHSGNGQDPHVGVPHAGAAWEAAAGGWVGKDGGLHPYGASYLMLGPCMEVLCLAVTVLWSRGGYPQGFLWSYWGTGCALLGCCFMSELFGIELMFSLGGGKCRAGSP